MNVSKYLNRIGLEESQEPTLDFLKLLQKTHLLNIPFENLDIHYGRKIILDKNHLFSKIVENKRGGFCYELNSLFYELLNSLGFNVRIISANVFNKENGYGKEFDHMALIVTIENSEYLTDVGFGDFSLEPLKLQLNLRQIDNAGEFYFDVFDDNIFRVNKIENGEHIPQYIFTKESRKIEEFMDMCLYHQTSAESHFTKQKMITLPTKNGRITLNGNKIKISENGLSKTTLINNESEFQEHLLRYFNIKCI